MPNVTIRNIRMILTAPKGINLAVVKVETSEPGLYGLGCATFTQRYKAVETALVEYLSPLLTGRPVEDIEDLWQLAIGNGYWRNGPVLNNAVSGVDEALWDIKGKLAGMPVYSLLGGRCRKGAAVYLHANGQTPRQVEESARALMEQGCRFIRCWSGSQRIEADESWLPAVHSPRGRPEGAYYDPKQYIRRTAGAVLSPSRRAGLGGGADARRSRAACPLRRRAARPRAGTLPALFP